MPESLGGRHVLEGGEVCAKCNQKFAKHNGADTLFIQALSPFRPLSSHKTKRGRLPPAAVYRNGRFERSGGGTISLAFNPSTPLGSELEEGIRALKVTTDKRGVSARPTVAFKADNRFSRGLSKIAFEYACYLKGREYALRLEFDVLRDYIRNKPHEFRPILMTQRGLPIERIDRVEVNWLGDSPQLPGSPLVNIRLLCMSFIVTLNEDTSGLLSLGVSLNKKMRRVAVTTFDRDGRCVAL